MAKRIREGQDIYLAHKILGKYNNGTPIIKDEKHDKILNPTDIDDKITVYEKQVIHWFLKPAKKLLKNDKNDFIVLMICMSYIEGVEQYRTGKSTDSKDKNGYGSNKSFCDSFSRILPTEDRNNLKTLYKQVRCGLFHNGMVGQLIILKDSYPKAINFNTENHDIEINPNKLFKLIQNDFNKYIEDLRVINNNDLRNNFDRMFNLVEVD